VLGWTCVARERFSAIWDFELRFLPFKYIEYYSIYLQKALKEREAQK
jgi:hypothetical protein